MFYNKLNKTGAEIAMTFAAEAGLIGKVTTDYAPNGEKYAFFKLSEVVRGNPNVDEACRRMRLAGFEPDVMLDSGTGMSTSGGFIGKAFSDKAKA